ncbi:MAG: sigma-70 family RNA polymerase sigma factor [Thermomicrobiales bacterium]
MNTNWLTDLAKHSAGDFEATSEMDRELSALAVRARRDDARWRLFSELAWKIERFVLRFRSWDIEPFDLDDVVQESYLVFLETIRRWRHQSVGQPPSGYLYYFLDVFPLWLASAVRRWRRPARPAVVKRAPNSSEDASDAAVIDEFCRNLGPQESTLLRLRVYNGLTVPHAARTMGLARRTAYRRWNRVLEVGRDYLGKAG